MIYKIFIFKHFLLVNPSKILSLKYTYIKEKILNVKIVKNYISAVKNKRALAYEARSYKIY